MADAARRREQLKELLLSTRECRRCDLSQSRTNVVFGAGNADAQVMFVGEAPGYHEDRQGLPFVGPAGKLLEKLLASIGLRREDVFIANVLKCRPPGNRDPQPEEISHCREFLEQQIDLIEPQVVCTMGNFSTKLLSDSPSGISRVRGLVQDYPGKAGVTLFPVFHPAAALHMPANLTILEQDFIRLGGMIGTVSVAEPDVAGDSTDAPLPADVDHLPQVTHEAFAPPSQPVLEPHQAQDDPEQLGLF